jgi:hypothetical protein
MPKKCYDVFLSRASGAQRYHWCSGDMHYLDEPVKKYHWQKMGRQFQCRGLRHDGYLMPADPQTNEQHLTREVTQAVTCNVVIRKMK